ncbi:MAG TPA: molybdopterin cofactor-binding domain-containing protein [Candidatus Acidoferrales bacterium]|nr:molybdopterin cofactor-binding domain-containing protein [Candidatus Acidoferrales bacterium]
MKLAINGAEVEVDERHAKTPLLWVLRDVVGLHGTKFGCGAGYCAACTVLIDGRNTKSCQTAAERAAGKQITTVEGASGNVVDAVRTAWHRGNVVQCGYCQPGQTLAAVALLESNPSPDDAAISRWMNGNLCRCGTYPRIRQAIHAAADTLASKQPVERFSSPPELDVPALTLEEKSDPIHPYVRVKPDGTIVVYSSQIEMGQGVHTGLATIVAEELDADFDAIRVVNASNGASASGDVYGNPFSGGFQITGASTSTRSFWQRYRTVAARARARLVAAAADAWQVPAQEILTESSVLSHPSGKRATYSDFTARAEQLPAPDAQPKPREAYNLIGKEGRLRVDAAEKILGKPTFTIDVSLPGMLTAIVLHPPRFGARATSIDDKAALAAPGVKAVVAIDEGVAVVAETFADAQNGLRLLEIVWDDAKAERRSSAQLLDEHRRLVETGAGAVVSKDVGDVAAALAKAAYVVDATYELPYLAHAPMEPNNAACRMGDNGVVEVWVSTESPVYAQMSAAQAAGIKNDEVLVHVTKAGGSFGLHSTSGHDPNSEAVQVAKALDWKYPIKLQSSREEEFKSGRYRAMAVHRVRAGADRTGRTIALHQQMAAQPTSVNLPFVGEVLFAKGVDFMTTTGAVDSPYAFENFKLESTNVDAGVPIMVWRSVGNSHTEFARESALDELAIAAKRDPVDLRRDLLANTPRTLQALEVAADLASWSTPLEQGRGRGVVCSSFLSHSAMIAEVVLDERNRVHIERIVFALDCGIMVNPDLIRAQVEGGILYALSAAVWGEVVLGDGGEILTQNFDRYPVVRMQSSPKIDVHLIESNEPPTGVGEVSVPSTAPALANAIASLTGKRIRQLPLSKTIPIF